MDVHEREIDRKLFITCRLCLEDDGVYQIIPTVQQQISFCFGIVVEPFDGLPQLICKKCKIILNEYSLNKRIFIEKQETLKSKLNDNGIRDDDPVPDGRSGALQDKGKPPGIDDLTSIAELPLDSDHETSSEKPLTKTRKRNYRISSSDSNDSTFKKKKKIKHTQPNHDNKLPENWKKRYFKHYVCRLCSKSFKHKKTIDKHCNERHAYIRSRHKNIIDSRCTISLLKIDDKPNITGLPNTVVLSKDKIVQDTGHQLYYFVYTTFQNTKNNVEKERESNNSDNMVSDSSDDFQRPIKQSKRKRIRIDSRSSTDTVLIDEKKGSEEFNKKDKKEKAENSTTNNNNTELPEPKDTICIDDSSDSETDLDKKPAKQINSLANSINNITDTVENINIEGKGMDEKVIHEIISVCRKKYETRKKLQTGDKAKQIESQLKHKILSIGRKIISKHTGFYNCTGLLRYLEHKNLHVRWDGKAHTPGSASKDANLVRMLIKNCKKDAVDDSGWTDVVTQDQKGTKHNANIPELECSTKKSDDMQELKEKPQVSKIVRQTGHQPQVELPQSTQQRHAGFQKAQPAHPRPPAPPAPAPPPLVQAPAVDEPQPQQIQFVQHPPPAQQLLANQKSMDQAVLYANVHEDSNTKKLLNPNPVANPKQLPKKININETKSLFINSRPTSNNDSLIVSLSENNAEPNMVMPVITSTTSLADMKKDDRLKTDNEQNVPNIEDKPAPRIKVKPASELMKPTNMNNIVAKTSNSMWTFNPGPAEPVNSDNCINIFVPNNLVSRIQSQSTQAPLVPPLAKAPDSTLLPVNKVTSETTKSNTETIILDTLDFPNTKTSCPFKYFRNLLLLHDIILTEANANINRNFICLLKFKVQFKQENKNVTLCLSLFCLENKFCMCVKDGNNINIHMGKMSANWQWEIMKVYQGDVTNKILMNAQKAGQNVYEKTKQFIFLLKSINQKQVV